ncbi:MAG: nicotinate-nucleotide adenylyltransferase [Candidatus Accumulibacter sp.]|jgi:nicotinate-nucleotide adenylyltransferase|nr:nicotinate-nucleotide adenylyltransferase [Accumulibacter sp.]
MNPLNLRENKPLGLFGGTFDPVHFAHLRLAEAAWCELGLSGVRWIPAGCPVLRDAPRVDARRRLEMVRRAIADNPHFELDAAEVEASQPSYTVPTLERLRSAGQFGEKHSLVLLVGADAFSSLPAWYRWESLFDLAHIAIAHRPGCPVDPETLPEPLSKICRQRFSAASEALSLAPAGSIVNFPMTPLDISATRVRQLLAAGLSTRYLLPDPVIAYIEEHRFYCQER